MAPGLLDRLPDVPGWVAGDRGLASDAFRDLIWDMGARPAIPPRRTDAPVACPPWIYANRRLLGRGPLGAPQGVARRRQPPRENGTILPRRPPARRHLRLAQELTDLSTTVALPFLRVSAQCERPTGSWRRV